MLEQKSSVAARFEALDALRGLCALLVVLFHIPIYHKLKDIGAFANLQFCVDLFFALSGFVLCHAYGQRLNSGTDGFRFMVMRFARLWPLHVVMLLLFVPIELSKLVFSRADASLTMDSQALGQGHSLYEFVTNILFLQSFNLHSGLSWNGPAWSAAVEFYVSMLFAAVVVLFPRRQREIFLALGLAAGLALYKVSPDTLFVSADWGFLRAIFSFFAGCLVYGWRAHSSARLAVPTLLEACCVLLAVAFALTTARDGSHFMFPLLAAIVIYVFSFDQGGISTLLRSSALQKLGLWSYSIYMTHTFVFQVMKMAASYVGQKAHLDLVGWHNDQKLMLLGTPEQAIVPALILSVVLVVPVAALTYRWIEKPAMDMARAGVPATARGIARPARRAVAMLRLGRRMLASSARQSVAQGVAVARAMYQRGATDVRT
jgi:peptidoglycan/LPS O-acetylase OafA/YrhL